MPAFTNKQEVDQFIDQLTPAQIKEALAYYMLHSSPLEELIASAEASFEFMKSELGDEYSDALREMEIRYRFFKGLC